MGLLGSMVAGAVSGGAQARNEQLKAEIEEMRRLSFAEIMQEYSKENAALANDMAVARDETNHGREVGLLDKKRGWDVEDYDKELRDKRGLLEYGQQLSNSAPSALDQKIATLDKLKASGKIGDDEYKVLLGIDKSGGMTAKDVAGIRVDAFKQAAKELERDMSSQRMKREERTKWINTRAAEIIAASTGISTGGETLNQPGMVLHPKTITDIATKLAGATPEQLPAGIADLKKKGVSEEDIQKIMKNAEAIRAKREKSTADISAKTESGNKEAAFLQRVASAQAMGQPLSPEDQAELARRELLKRNSGYRPITPEEREQRRREAQKQAGM